MREERAVINLVFVCSGLSHDVKYAFDMEFFAEIVKADSAWNTKGRHVILTLSKKEQEEEYWPRLMKDKTKNHRLQIDWSKWVDEDEVEDAADPAGFDADAMQGFGGGGAGGMPGMGGMGGAGGMPGMGGMGGMDLASMMGGMGGGAGGMPGMGGAGGMDMAKMQEMMAQMQMGGAGGPGGLPDSDDEDEEEEAAGEPTKADDGLGDLDGEAEKDVKKE